MLTQHSPERFSRPSLLQFMLVFAVLAIVISSIGSAAPSVQQLVQGVPRMGNLMDRMLPPNLDPDFLWRVLRKIVETLQIAIAGTAIGIVCSLPIAWLAARRVSPFPRLCFVFKALVSLFRTVPDLVWALLFVASVGLGAVAGTMTIIVDTIGFCGKFFAEAMEGAEREPQEALQSLGASKSGILMAAVLPDAAPSMVNSSIFALEMAVRSSVVLGLVGAGGIGQELKVAFDLFQYQNASTIILFVFIIVLLMEWATDSIRTRLSRSHS